MSSIINQIIEIDTIAQKKLNDAMLMKEEIKQQVIDKTKQTNALIDEKTNSRIKKIEEIETQYAQTKKEEIKLQNDETLEQLEKTYVSMHEQLENAIFNRIIE